MNPLRAFGRANPEEAASAAELRADTAFFTQVLSEREDMAELEVPSRPSAPRPPPSPVLFLRRPAAAPSPSAAFRLGPERPLKLFQLDDFEFMQILGTAGSPAAWLIYARHGDLWPGPARQVQDG